MRKIRAIVKRADKAEPYVTNISDSLENFQKFVGGYIEAVTISDDLVIICNEEGRLQGLPYNCTVLGIPFYGDILFVSTDGDEFADCHMEMAMLALLLSGK